MISPLDTPRRLMTCLFNSRFVPAYLVFPAALFILMPGMTRTTAAQEWSAEAKKEHSPTNPENRIIKWCSDSDGKVRYASANLQVKGYSPCGVLQTAKTCDAGGNRLIGGKTPPAGYLDCAVGPRIVIERDGESLLKEDEEVEASDHEPMSLSERRSLKTELGKLIKKQKEEDPLTYYQSQLLALCPSCVQSGQGKPSAGSQVSQKQIEEIERNVKPLMEELTKQLFSPVPDNRRKTKW